jgi:multiple sugar transport system permease protein
MPDSANATHWSRQDNRFLFWALSPALILIVLIGILPNVYTVILSLHDLNLNKSAEAQFIGLDNYTSLLGNDRFWHALIFTVLFALAATTIELIYGFFVAYLLADKEVSHTYSSAIRTLLMLPFVAPPVVVSYIFKTLIYDPSFGYLNYFLGIFNLPPYDIFQGSMQAPVAILIMEVILRTPFIVIILYAGISSIDSTLLEAARIDGASWWQEITQVVLPVIMPIIVIAYALRFIDALKMFDEIYVVTKGGPGFVTENISLFVTDQAFNYYKMGYSAAAAFLFLILVMVLVSAFVRSFRL